MSGFRIKCGISVFQYILSNDTKGDCISLLIHSFLILELCIVL